METRLPCIICRASHAERRELHPAMKRDKLEGGGGIIGDLGLDIGYQDDTWDRQQGCRVETCERYSTGTGQL
jgi:hypothetical protein